MVITIITIKGKILKLLKQILATLFETKQRNNWFYQVQFYKTTFSLKAIKAVQVWNKEIQQIKDIKK